MAFDMNAYQVKYQRENMIRKTVVFSKLTDDVVLLEWAEKQPESFSAYIKRLIQEDMRKRDESKK